MLTHLCNSRDLGVIVASFDNIQPNVQRSTCIWSELGYLDFTFQDLKISAEISVEVYKISR